MRISDWSSDVCSSDLDLTFGERDQRHPRKLQMLEERRDIGLITRHAVERLGEDDIELAGLRVSEQPLYAGTQDHTRARDRGILISAFNLPKHGREPSRDTVRQNV